VTSAPLRARTELYYLCNTVFEFKVDPQAKLPVYRQLIDQAHFAINTGALAPGQRLPSLRSISTRHDVAVNTVVKAFKVLEERGLISAGPRSGYRVRAASPKTRGGAPGADPAARYQARGVSATKREVHAAIEALDPGLFPLAFCKITEDYLTGDPDLCNVIHADGSGSKSLLAYLHYRETGDASAFRGIAQDSIVMNLDDLCCVGATERILSSSTINRNAKRIGADVLAELIGGTDAFLSMLRQQGVGVHNGGGETADVGDLTPTVVVDSCTAAVMRKAHVIAGEGIRAGLRIIGLSSTGRATYEDRENSGIGSNGLTSARHDLLSAHYREQYPETFDPLVSRDLVYSGPYRLADKLPGSGFSVGEALLSPTRSYAPVVAALLASDRGRIKGIVHCSGGGQTKCLRFGRQVHFIKDDLFPIPSIFKVIQRVSKTPWKEMYQVYNMGHRLEIYCAPRDASTIIAAARAYGIDARPIGRTEKSDGSQNQLTISHGARKLRYAAT
jgi:phosphoribosylformylglycinamidine cyclo-ligase